MMIRNKIDLSEYCRGCLTKDRRLVPIDNLFQMFLKIMDGEVISAADLTNVPRMCWECRAILRNTEKFIEKAKTAHGFFTEASKKMIQAKSLSNLTTIINKYNFEETLNDSEIEISGKIDNICPQLDVDLKEEYLSNDEKNDPDYYGDIKEETVETDEYFKEETETDEYFKEETDTEGHVKEETDQSIKREGIQNTAKKQIRKDKVKSIKAKYKLISLKQGDAITPTFETRQIDEEERIYWGEQDKTARNYRCMPYKCELCITGYAKQKYYDQHMKKFHSPVNGKFECDICKKRLINKIKLTNHIRNHYIKYVCLVCQYENYRKWKMSAHLSYAHKRAVMCLTCGLKFEKSLDFYKHYNVLHAHVICDYCGKKWNNKDRLIKHIRLRHYVHRCDICNRNYSSFDALAHHTRLNHVKSRMEECYCVECNIQFENISRYTVHLKTSVKHKKFVGIPCPECNKVYHKKTSMNNHYKYVHLKKTANYCEKCSRYFLTGYRLRQHQARTHDKIEPIKDKICPHCGRAFSTNRILNNHIRTHTGERPFVCDICSSKFTQKTALVVHKRSIHKIGK
ncbi:zinc finger protein 436-like [Nymphalis io]|uniref:zinc finger protein 436-like n=1 Tax=Inachis io TaxID=171585 RepID=UPI002169AF58|nr:zinc finger protein 436-like [Nymphalis io]